MTSVKVTRMKKGYEGKPTTLTCTHALLHGIESKQEKNEQFHCNVLDTPNKDDTHEIIATRTNVQGWVLPMEQQARYWCMLGRFEVDSLPSLACRATAFYLLPISLH
jgi:hypothetical protein